MMENIGRAAGVHAVLRGGLVGGGVVFAVVLALAVTGTGAGGGPPAGDGVAQRVGPAPAAFLSLRAAGEATRQTGAERLEQGTLARLLFAPPRAEAAEPPGAAAPMQAEAPRSGTAQLPRAEVVGRLEQPGGRMVWLVRTDPDGRFVRVAGGPPPGAPVGASPPPPAYFEDADGRTELVIGERRYRLTEPPWTAGASAIRGGSP